MALTNAHPTRRRINLDHSINMNGFKSSILILFLAVCIGTQASPDQAKHQEIYVLQFRDGHTEGSWVLVLDNGYKYEVTFAKESNVKAVETLAALDPEIIRLNTSPEHNIYLVGNLKKSEATQQPARQISKAVMRLDGWYLKAPFYIPPLVDPDGAIEVSNALKPTHFLPAGEREDTEPTRKLRASLEIHHDERLNLFWIGAESPFTKFLSKSVPQPKVQK